MTTEAQISLASWLKESRDWIDAALDELLPRADEHPQRLHEAMRYAIFGGGKRLRPALCRLFCSSLGGEDSKAVLPGAALELIHTYSLVHDDLPCMDDDDLRRGRATVHVAYDEAIGVLVGDALLTQAFGILAEPSIENPAELVGCLARAAGSRGMVGGQALDLSLEASANDADANDAGAFKQRIEALGDMHERKTGALFAAACEMGALAARADARTCRLAASYGLALGRAFQATDDLLDVTGDAATLGKTPGKDQALSRPTLVAALGLEDARAKARDLAEAAHESARALGFGSEHRAVVFVEFVLSRRA